MNQFDIARIVGREVLIKDGSDGECKHPGVLQGAYLTGNAGMKYVIEGEDGTLYELSWMHFKLVRQAS